MSTARNCKFLVCASLLSLSSALVSAQTGAASAGTAPAAGASANAAALSPAAKQWWADISALANDGMEGRLTGSPGFMRAARYVISRFEAEGLKPAGITGFMQPVEFEQQLIDQNASSLDLAAGDGSSVPLNSGRDSRIGAGGAPVPASIDAPLVFLGYGLHLPTQGADDFAGLDLKGKVVVVLSGGPADVSGPIKSSARFARAEQLGKLGAVGIVTLTTPKQTEIPWARQILLASQPGMYLEDATLRETPDGFINLAIDPAKSETLFAGSGHTFAELCALADASKPVPRFALSYRLKGRIVVKRERLSSPNLVAELPGGDRELSKQFVVVSAHLDHLGMGAPIDGDRSHGAAIYKGAMDDASGVATVLDIAHRLKHGPKPRRSILFLVVTAEEKGLLGSHYFARRPTVPKDSIVADLNFDMPLPLWPLTKVFAPGEDESTLGADARAVAAAQGLQMAPDALPDRNVFIRTDQFSFVREGIPALAFKFGFAKDSPEFQLEHDWRANRYHAPSDDLDQPVMKEQAVRLDAYVAALAARVADADARPAWLPTSIFRPQSAP
jgi:Zn-dependent M28 family amino/carboxypeptidase